MVEWRGLGWLVLQNNDFWFLNSVNFALGLATEINL